MQLALAQAVPRIPTPPRLVHAGAFVTGDVSGNGYDYGYSGYVSCPTGSAPIHQQAVCKSAAIALGRTYVREDSNTLWPHGCYWYTSGSSVYLGTAWSGAGNAQAKLLCAVTTGAPTSHTRTASAALGAAGTAIRVLRRWGTIAVL